MSAEVCFEAWGGGGVNKLFSLSLSADGMLVSIKKTLKEKVIFLGHETISRSCQIGETILCEAEIESQRKERGARGQLVRTQGYLAHKKQPIPLGPPYDPRHGPTVWS